MSLEALGNIDGKHRIRRISRRDAWLWIWVEQLTALRSGTRRSTRGAGDDPVRLGDGSISGDDE